MSYFTPISGLLGGSLIGLSASVLLLFNGDILGASGIISSAILSPVKTLQDVSQHWNLVFLVSFMVTANLYITLVEDDLLLDPRSGDTVMPTLSPIAYAIGGFFVGFGTKLGNGCTSGHGICGMARFSKRSFAAVGMFMATGILSAMMLSPTSSLAPYTKVLRMTPDTVPEPSNSHIALMVSLGIGVLCFVGRCMEPNSGAPNCEKTTNYRRKLIPAALAGMLFAVGLAISQMVVFSKVYGFLDLSGITRGTYDPTLMTVMGSGFLVSCIAYQNVSGHGLVQNPNALTCPIALKDGQFSVPNNKTIDTQLLAGAALFGVGWGVAGLCPGPALFYAAAGVPLVMNNWWPAFAVGSLLAKTLKENINQPSK